MRLMGMLSAACLTLLLSSATDQELFSQNLASYNVTHQLQPASTSVALGFEAKRHSNPLHSLVNRYLVKSTERQNQTASFLPVTDSIYALNSALSSSYYRYIDGSTAFRAKGYYESNLIYRFIHSRHRPSIA